MPDITLFLSRQKSAFVKTARTENGLFLLRFVEDDAGIPGVFQGGRNGISAKRAVFGVRRRFSYAPFFDIDRSGTNQGKTHGDGIYLSTSKDAFDYAGDKVMQLYASIKHPFEMYLTKNQAERIYDKYFKPFHVDKYNTYRPHVIQSLQSATKVFDYLTEAAETNGIKTSDILSELG